MHIKQLDQYNWKIVFDAPWDYISRQLISIFEGTSLLITSNQLRNLATNIVNEPLSEFNNSQHFKTLICQQFNTLSTTFASGAYLFVVDAENKQIRATQYQYQ